jgi:hypothetical protein
MTVNSRRVLLGTLVGGVVWTLWSFIINAGVLASRYRAAQETGVILRQPRLPLFVVWWILTLFILSYVVAWLYASVRATLGAGPKTALSVGFLVGFAAGFPTNFATATWGTLGRAFPFWWMLELWVGAIMAALVAGWIYRES